MGLIYLKDNFTGVDGCCTKKDLIVGALQMESVVPFSCHGRGPLLLVTENHETGDAHVSIFCGVAES